MSDLAPPGVGVDCDEVPIAVLSQSVAVSQRPFNLSQQHQIIVVQFYSIFIKAQDFSIFPDKNISGRNLLFDFSQSLSRPAELDERLSNERNEGSIRQDLQHGDCGVEVCQLEVVEDRNDATSLRILLKESSEGEVISDCGLSLKSWTVTLQFRRNMLRARREFCK